MENTLGVKVVAQFSSMQSSRSIWESLWSDLKDFIRPETLSFNTAASNAGMLNSNRLYDGTAPWSLEQLASGLHSYLTSPTERWFSIVLKGERFQDLPDVVKMWLEYVSDLIYEEYSRPQTNFNAAVHEMYLDIGAFGTGVVFQSYIQRHRALHFRSFPLASCWIKENSDGAVDTLYRKTKWTARQLQQSFEQLPEKVARIIGDAKNPDKEFEVLHAVFPREDRSTEKFIATQKPFASVWVVIETKEVLDESGFDEFPYHVPRWSKVAGETYGRSPGMTCLPDIRMLNTMCKTVIKSAEKLVDPPLLVPDDGFMLPIKTAPGSLIFFEAGMQDQLKPLETKAQPNLALDTMEQKRDQIRRCFFVDWLIREKKRERQTTTEIMDDRNEMLRQLAPILGRMQTEFLGPSIARSFSILSSLGRIPPFPMQMPGAALEIIYVSPAAKAQIALKAVTIQQYVQEIIPLSQLDPSVMDGINLDEVAKQIAILKDVSRTVLRSPEEVAQLRQQRQQQQQQQQMLEAGQGAASAAKDIAMAQRTSGL